MVQGSTGTNPPWAANIIHTRAGVGPGERVLVAVDEPLHYAQGPLLQEVLVAGPSELWAYTFPDGRCCTWTERR